MSDDAYNIVSGEEKAWRELAGADPASVAVRSLAAHDPASGSYALTVFGEDYLVSPGTRTVVNLTNPARPREPLLDLSIPVYLVRARPANPSGELVKGFTGGEIFAQGSHVLPMDEVAREYGSDGEGFVEAGRVELGGVPDGFGDAAVRFSPFPRVSMTAILWLSDDEFPARASLLFDSNAALHMPVDIVWAVALVACRRMLGFRGAGYKGPA